MIFRSPLPFFLGITSFSVWEPGFGLIRITFPPQPTFLPRPPGLPPQPLKRTPSFPPAPSPPGPCSAQSELRRRPRPPAPSRRVPHRRAPHAAAAPPPATGTPKPPPPPWEPAPGAPPRRSSADVFGMGIARCDHALVLSGALPGAKARPGPARTGTLSPAIPLSRGTRPGRDWAVCFGSSRSRAQKLPPQTVHRTLAPDNNPFFPF